MCSGRVPGRPTGRRRRGGWSRHPWAAPGRRARRRRGRGGRRDAGWRRRLRANAQRTSSPVSISRGRRGAGSRRPWTPCSEKISCPQQHIGFLRRHCCTLHPPPRSRRSAPSITAQPMERGQSLNSRALGSRGTHYHTISRLPILVAVIVA